MISRRLFCSALAALGLLAATASQAEDRFITVASTTSTEQSGLFGHLLPIFQQQSGIAVRVVAVGTGQALALGQRGDADALLVHDRPGEDKFVVFNKLFLERFNLTLFVMTAKAKEKFLAKNVLLAVASA